MKKIVTILGARPQFIKAAALSRAIAGESSIKEVIIHTGQHYDENMSEVFFQQMDIPKPDHNLSVKSSLHGQMTGQMLERIEEVLLAEKPDTVLIYGDTNSTIAGALAAKKLHMKVAHVEAGLRSYNMRMPEEVNRILTDRISDFLFCPSQAAIDNLLKEGFENIASKIYDVGDIMKDVAQFYSNKARKPQFDIPNKFILTTIHRAENTDDASRLMEILNALNSLSQVIPVVLPLHPRTKKVISQLKFTGQGNLIIVDPVGYLEMVYLLKHCSCVVTDSGGLQKEAYYFHKFCVTTRDETEWTELVEHGYNKIVGADSRKIISAVNEFLNSNKAFDSKLYGDGNTAQKILDILKRS
jgi:UDP-GlcNAc3NAcA epimerase